MEDLLVQRFMHLLASKGGDPESDVLRLGSSGICCSNLRRSLGILDIRLESRDPEKFDEELESAVLRFQKTFGHPIQDGQVGPGTRRRIIGNILVRCGPDVFGRFQDPEEGRPPRVFVSYSTVDSAAVDTVEAWLSNHDVQVLRYTHSFQPGGAILEKARKAIAIADKVVVFHSVDSAKADWVHSEIAMTEELETRLGKGKRLLVYLRLDGEQLPAHDTDRIAIVAAKRPLKEVGMELLHAIRGQKPEPPHLPYDEDAPLP